jgi:photosystem I subunit 9
LYISQFELRIPRTKQMRVSFNLTTYIHLIIYVLPLCITIKNTEGGFFMRDLKTYLSVAPVISTLWFGSLAGLLIEINRFFPDALTFPFFFHSSY